MNEEQVYKRVMMNSRDIRLLNFILEILRCQPIANCHLLQLLFRFFCGGRELGGRKEGRPIKLVVINYQCIYQDSFYSSLLLLLLKK